MDGMGNIGATEQSYPDGSSSAASFMKQIRSAMAARLPLASSQPLRSSFRNNQAMSLLDPKESQQIHITQLFALPSRRAADNMMRVYWNEVHTLYPFLLPTGFMQSYQQIWDGEEQEVGRSLLYCILNLIFAICCQVTKRDSPEESAIAANMFYKRAEQLVRLNLIGEGSIELVQSLLLMGQYLQSTEWPHRCWVVIGLAIRVSQGLGLHLPNTTKGFGYMDRELARRLWHGCVFMDRVVSMTLGRPLMINREDAHIVPLPQPIDDLNKPSNIGQDQQSGEVPRITFFVESLKLYYITEETLSAMYKNDGLASQGSPLSLREKLENFDFNTLVRIDAAIDNWYISLPQQLQINHDRNSDSYDLVLHRQANILRLRCLQVRILLFRPLFSLLLAVENRTRSISSSLSENGFPLAIGLLGAQKCILAALEVISIIHEEQNTNSSSNVEPLPAWWYEVFCKSPDSSELTFALI